MVVSSETAPLLPSPAPARRYSGTTTRSDQQRLRQQQRLSPILDPASQHLPSQSHHYPNNFNIANHRHHQQSHSITARHWAVLFLACLTLFSNYYCYDLPGALNVQLREWLGTNYSKHQYQLNLLYSLYSLPNIVLPLVGGILIDRLSVRRMLLLFSICICIGQCIFATGVTSKSFWIMALGRFIFGIGGECLEVAQAKIVTEWFKSRSLGFALGLNLSSARIATALNDNISPRIAHGNGGVVAATWTGLGVCLVSFGCGLMLLYLDRPESRRIAGVRLDPRDRGDSLLAINGSGGGLENSPYSIVGRGAINASMDSTLTLSPEAMEEEEEIEKEFEMADDDDFRLSEMLTLQHSFWILALVCICLYGSVVPFIHVSADFLGRKWYAKDPRRVGTIMSIPDLISSIGSPLCGLLVDRFGHRARYISVSAVLLILAHLLLGFTMTSPVISLLILGAAYSLFASVLWPCIPFLVQDHQLGTAYGIVTIALNVSLTIFPIVVATILHGSQGSYDWVEVLFICLALLGLGLSIWFNILDRRAAKAEALESLEQLIEHQAAVVGGGGEDSVADDMDDMPRRTSVVSSIRTRLHGPFDSDDDDQEENDRMVTTRCVAEGVVTIVPHRSRRHSLAGGVLSQSDRMRLRNNARYNHHGLHQQPQQQQLQQQPIIPASVPLVSSPYLQ